MNDFHYSPSAVNIAGYFCWGNAVAESFFASLKKERIKQRIYNTREKATTDVADSIESFYNPRRRHSHIGGVSPDDFETAAKRRQKGLHEILGTREDQWSHLGRLLVL